VLVKAVEPGEPDMTRGDTDSNSPCLNPPTTESSAGNPSAKAVLKSDGKAESGFAIEAGTTDIKDGTLLQHLHTYLQIEPFAALSNKYAIIT
jgi:hypothetical protein